MNTSYSLSSTCQLLHQHKNQLQCQNPSSHPHHRYYNHLSKQNLNCKYHKNSNKHPQIKKEKKKAKKEKKKNIKKKKNK